MGDGPTFQVTEVLRSGPAPRYRARLDQEEVLLKFADRRAPWSDPRSAFYAGRGLTPPFCPLELHEANAWARAVPSQVLGAGLHEGVPFVALRWHPGVRLLEPRPAQAAALLEGVLPQLACLHAAGVVHRDIRPHNIIAQDSVFTVLDLDVSLCGGVGPVGLIGGSRWRAPSEIRNNARGDLWSLGRLVSWMATGDPARVDPDVLGAAPSRVVAAMAAGELADAAAALRALGEAAPTVSEPAWHPSLAWWAWGGWVSPLLALGRGWEVIERLDEAAAGGMERWALAGAAARILAHAAQRGGAAWLQVATACELLAEASPPADTDGYRQQQAEALQRARRPWDPASGTHGDAPSLAARHRLAAAAAKATSPGEAAWVAYCCGDLSGARAKLRDAGATPLAEKTRASLALQEPGGASAATLSVAALAAALDALEQLSSTASPALRGLLEGLPQPRQDRAVLRLALAHQQPAVALRVARRLAARGRWDDATAAALVALSPTEAAAEADPLLARAAEIVDSYTQPDPQAAVQAAAREIVSGVSDEVCWWMLLRAVAETGTLPQARAVRDAAGVDPALLGMELVRAGRVQDAAAMSATGSAPQQLQRLCLQLLSQDLQGAADTAAAMEAEDPFSPLATLARALVAAHQGEQREAERMLELSGILGAPAALRGPLQRALS